MNQSYIVLTEAYDAVQKQAKLETNREIKFIIDEAEKELEALVQWMQPLALLEEPSK